MLIDWFTVGAQALNFLILVWLLKRFLYKPILQAIDAREKRIASELADADSKKTEAKKERDEFQRKNEEFEQQRAALLNKATDEAKAERQRLLDEARKAADALSAKRQETLTNDAHQLNQALRRRTQQEVFAIAQKTLADLASTNLEARMTEVFTRHLREMDGKAKGSLGNALKTATEPGLVRSAFDLPPEQRVSIQNALNETFASDVHVRFETSPDLVSGIEFSSNGQKVAWSIADYLSSMEKGVDELLKEKDKQTVDLTPQIAKRAYDLYEQQGRKGDSAAQNRIQAVREIREGQTKSEPKPEPEPNAEAKVEPKPAAKVEPKPAAPAEPDSMPVVKAKPKPETKVDPKLEKPTPETKSQ